MPSSPRLTPSRLLNIFCAVTAILWIVLLAITFSDNTVKIVVATGVWAICLSLTLLLAIYLVRRRWGSPVTATPESPVRREGLTLIGSCMILLSWSLVTLCASNWVVGHWQSEQRLWSGFVFNLRYGWYPEPFLDHRELQTPHGSYQASTDLYGHRNSLPYVWNGVPPIILQGDSNTFGFGLRDNETLASLLNLQLPEPAVFNLGIPGFDLNQYYYQYEEFGGRFHNATRIIHWNIGNDFTLSALETPNYFRRPYLYVGKGKTELAPTFQAPFPVQGYGQSFVPPFRKYDPLIDATAYDWADIYPEMFIRIPLSRQLIRTFHPKVCQVVERLPLQHPRYPQLELYNPSWMLLKRELWPEPFTQYARDFRQLLRVLKRQNPRLIICPFPFREQVIPAEYAVQRYKLLNMNDGYKGYTEADLDPLAFNDFLREACEYEGIRLIDPTEKFLQAKDPLRLYQEGDQHLSVHGMKLCAQALIEEGIEQK